MKKSSSLFDGNGPYALCILPGATVGSLEEMAAKITGEQVRRGLPTRKNTSSRMRAAKKRNRESA